MSKYKVTYRGGKGWGLMWKEFVADSVAELASKLPELIKDLKAVISIKKVE